MKLLIVGICLISVLVDLTFCQIYEFVPPTKHQKGVPRNDREYKEYRDKETCLTKRFNCRSRDEYPNIDGSCNNVENPSWGATDQVMPRLLPPEYDDDKDSPRSNGVFRKLPSPREVSNVMKESRKKISSDVSHLHVLFGQLLAHDIVHTPIIKNRDGTKLDCNCANPHRDCINIEVPHNDEQRIRANKKCLPLARSKSATAVRGCKFPHREQISTMSSVIDMTFIYGKSDQEARDLRDPHSNAGEVLLVANPVGGPHRNLPNQDDLKRTAISKTVDCPMKVHTPVNIPCFVAGDVRANENPGLQSIHTLMARYHNYVARELKSINRFWNSDKVFNVARRILSGVFQSITYREYLPPLLGPTWSKRFDLTLVDEGFWNGYDARYNPAITNEFTTAAFRYGHSQVAEKLSRVNGFYKGNIPDVKSEGTFFTSDALLDKFGGGTGAILRGFMMDNAEKTDNTLVDALRNQLFTEFGKTYGGDLFAINIQRGRDHGVPGYNKYRELCGLPRAKSFSDLSREIPYNVINQLRQVYDSVDDIDLYSGGLAENHVEGGEIGPTFACILAYGFRAVRKGDRYWHENEDSPSPFYIKQLESIRKTTLTSIMCLVGEDMKYVMNSPMTMKGGKPNRIVSCSNINTLDISLWREDYSYPYNNPVAFTESVWTPWFVTIYSNDWDMDVRKIQLRLLRERPDEMCNGYSKYETRTARGGRSFLQIRFFCPKGSLKMTDFPFQLSQNVYWTSWITPRSSGYNKIQSIQKHEFNCEKLVAIQAMSGKKFASETGDVFEKFNVKDGFVCRDQDQPKGRCENYKVRALCSGKRKSSNENVYNSYPTPGYSPRPHPTTKSPEPYIELVNVEEQPSSTGISHDDLETAEVYCDYYNICCSEPIYAYTIRTIPNAVTNYAKYLCGRHGLCCDA